MVSEKGLIGSEYDWNPWLGATQKNAMDLYPPLTIIDKSIMVHLGFNITVVLFLDM